MGYGRYSTIAYNKVRAVKGYDSKRADQIFASRDIDPEMDPRKVIVRESRDSDEHPNSVPIVVALDVTGSMGFVPEALVRHDLPKLMDTIIEAGIPDPQVMFCGIGDFIYDRAPLQVGQFESSAELLDRWLTKVFIEGGGGGNNNESYNLAHLFAARHTVTDAWEKRGEKGFLFTIGDEPCADRIPGEVIGQFTSALGQSVSTSEILAEAQERYHVFHLHVVHDHPSQSSRRKQGWRDLLGENFIVVQDHQMVAKTMADIVVKHTAVKHGRRPASVDVGPDIDEVL